MSFTLEVRSARKSYRGREVLKDCSLKVTAGVTALMGANGCGKSTLLRIASLLEEADSGRVSYTRDDEALLSDMNLRRMITLVLPKGGIFNTSTFANVSYGLKVRGFDKAKVISRTEEALERVGLIHKRRQNALTLSSGEAQRLSLARALALRPQVLFLDEPTASVDEENTELIEGLIEGMKVPGKGPSIVLMTTHDSAQALRLADTTLRMSKGVLEL